MAKVTGPLLSLDASGTVASTLTFSKWKGVNYVRQRIIPTYRNTTEQMAVRDIVKDASLAWKLGSTVGGVAINATYKTGYATLASGMAMSGFNLFIKDCMTMNLVDTAGLKSYDGTLVVPATPGETE